MTERMVSVPVEPTEAMLLAGALVGPDTNNGEFSYDDARTVFAAMLTAAPVREEGGAVSADVLVTMRDHYQFALKGPWPDIKTPNYALAGLFQMAGDEIEHLRAQPPAREDAQPVAYDARKLKKGDQVWIRATVTDPCTSCCGVSVKSDTGSEVHRYIAPADVRAHPAPDALRVAVEALEAIKEVSGDRAASGYNETGRLARINERCDKALAALQAEQKGGA